MKTCGGVDVWIHPLLTSALVGGEWSAKRSGRFTPGERAPGAHSIGGWVGPRAGLDDMQRREIFVGFEIYTAVIMKSINFWDITPYSPLTLNEYGQRNRLHPKIHFSRKGS
jgi:hypothetical protein